MLWLSNEAIEYAVAKCRREPGYKVGIALNSRATAVQAVTTDNLQAKIDLVNHIGIIAASAANQGNTSIKGIRDNRRREQHKTHIDYVKESSANE